LQQLFQDNRDARVQHLETEMRTIKQRDEPVGQYCQQLKAMADELHELGVKVDDRSIITCLLASISDQFDKVSSLIPLLRPLPTFSGVRSMLQREEHSIIHKRQHHSAFYTNNRQPYLMATNGGSTPVQRPQTPWPPAATGVHDVRSSSPADIDAVRVRIARAPAVHARTVRVGHAHGSSTVRAGHDPGSSAVRAGHALGASIGPSTSYSAKLGSSSVRPRHEQLHLEQQWRMDRRLRGYITHVWFCGYAFLLCILHLLSLRSL
jgi:hypothetical protein